MHCEAIGTLVVFLDVSGSIYRYLDTLARFWTEVREAAHELKPDRVIVAQIDIQITDIAEYTADDLPDELEATGGGDTDFRPGFDWLDEQGIHPTVCLYFTDMLCSDYPDTEPPYPVVWCNWGPASQRLEPRTLGRAHRHRLISAPPVHPRPGPTTPSTRTGPGPHPGPSVSFATPKARQERTGCCAAAPSSFHRYRESPMSQIALRLVHGHPAPRHPADANTDPSDLSDDDLLARIIPDAHALLSKRRRPSRSARHLRRGARAPTPHRSPPLRHTARRRRARPPLRRKRRQPPASPSPLRTPPARR